MCMDVLYEIYDPKATGTGWKVLGETSDGTRCSLIMEAPLMNGAIAAMDRYEGVYGKVSTYGGVNRYEGVYVFLCKSDAEKLAAKAKQFGRRSLRPALVKVRWYGLRCLGVDGARGTHTYGPSITTDKIEVIEEEFFCPKCYQPLLQPKVRNSLSRDGSKTYICNDCGDREAFQDFEL